MVEFRRKRIVFKHTKSRWPSGPLLAYIFENMQKHMRCQLQSSVFPFAFLLKGLSNVTYSVSQCAVRQQLWSSMIRFWLQRYCHFGELFVHEALHVADWDPHIRASNSCRLQNAFWDDVVLQNSTYRRLIDNYVLWHQFQARSPFCIWAYAIFLNITINISNIVKHFSVILYCVVLVVLLMSQTQLAFYAKKNKQTKNLYEVNKQRADLQQSDQSPLQRQ